ncbi:Gfo/Idh/MocA family protein [Radiobacillus sp. PE A8.2]|uniref:Gfo/Idh/MocA family protein n=1 Tax=Radiobacillus sp. PE A8.2 TaxID=3380349 RepID=UPI0038902B52
MKFSIIGCQHAHIGIFIKEMLDLGHECAGIYEKENVTLATNIAEEFQLSLVSNMETLLDESIDIVGCAEINNEKIDIIEKCEGYGKHVMIDKPAVTSKEAYERLKAVIDRGHIQIGMLLTERFRASIYTLKKMLDRGDLGSIVNISMRKPHRLTPKNRPQWHFSKEQCGGIVIDLFVHDYDLLRWLTGKNVIESNGLMAKNILPEYPNFFDTANLQVEMDGHILAQLYADWYNPESSWTWGDCRIFVTGTEGVAEIRLEGDPLVASEEMLLLVTHDEVLRKVELESPANTITKDFIQRINGEVSTVNHEDILLATRSTIEADERVKKTNRFALTKN